MSNDKLSNRVLKSLREYGPILVSCNQKGMTFKAAAKKAKISTPSAMLYARLLDLKWTEYKPRGPYKKNEIQN